MSIIPWKSETNIPVQNAARNSLFAVPQDMNQLLDNMFNFWPSMNSLSQNLLTSGLPVVDVVEHKKSFTIKAELPGIDADKITLEAGDDFITIQCEQADCKMVEDGNYLRRECSSSNYERVVTLPHNIDIEKAHAEFKNGILTIFARKKSAQMPKGKAVPIKEAA